MQKKQRGQDTEHKKDVNSEEREFHDTTKKWSLKVNYKDIPVITNTMYIGKNNVIH